MPPPAFPHGPVPPPKNNKNRNIVLAIIGAIAAICLLGCCVLGVVFADSDAPNDDADQQSDTDSQSDSSSAAQEDEEDEEDAATLDDEVSDGDFTFVVTGVEDGVTQVGDDVLGATPQGQFVLIDLTVENTGDSAELFTDSSQKVFDTDGKEYSADSEAAIYIEDNQVLLEEINPGNTIEAQLVFDVPDGTELDSIELYSSSISSGVTVSLS